MNRPSASAAGLLAAAVLVVFGFPSPVLAPEPAQAQPAPGYDPMALGRSARPPAEQDVPLNPDFDDLPDTEGVEDVYYTCSGCHSLAIVKQQRLTDARWDYTLQWMIKEQRMPEPDEETKRRILDYLKRHFSSER